MMERRSGQHIYDSLSVTKIDPAFLKKDGDQYELHVYPLSSGHTRKVKINFITPAKFSGLTASCEMPLAFLKSSAGTTPVNFMFRLRIRFGELPLWLRCQAHLSNRSNKSFRGMVKPLDLIINLHNYQTSLNYRHLIYHFL